MKWVSGVSVHGSNPQLRMSALGQKLPRLTQSGVSALPPKAAAGHRRPALQLTAKSARRVCGQAPLRRRSFDRHESDGHRKPKKGRLSLPTAKPRGV